MDRPDYAVARGKNPVIYDNRNECKNQAHGYSDNSLKKLNDLGDAVEFVAKNSNDKHIAGKSSEYSSGSSKHYVKCHNDSAISNCSTGSDQRHVENPLGSSKSGASFNEWRETKDYKEDDNNTLHNSSDDNYDKDLIHRSIALNLDDEHNYEDNVHVDDYDYDDDGWYYGGDSYREHMGDDYESD